VHHFVKKIGTTIGTDMGVFKGMLLTWKHILDVSSLAYDKWLLKILIPLIHLLLGNEWMSMLQ
jgi:hypothetical protein